MKRWMFILCAFVSCALMLCPIALLGLYAFLPPLPAGQIARGTAFIQAQSFLLSLAQFRLLFADGQRFLYSFTGSFCWCFAAAACQVVFSIPVGFILAKYRTRFASVFTLVFTFATVIPLQMILIPAYRIFQEATWLPRSIGLYIPMAFAPFGAVLMRQVCKQIPEESVEFFRLESQSFPRLMSNVVFPFCQSYGIILFLFAFIESWGMIEQPLILLAGNDLQPFSILLYNMQIEQPQIVFAASFASLLPIVAMYIIISVKKRAVRNRNVCADAARER